MSRKGGSRLGPCCWFRCSAIGDGKRKDGAWVLGLFHMQLGPFQQEKGKLISGYWFELPATSITGVRNLVVARRQRPKYI